MSPDKKETPTPQASPEQNNAATPLQSQAPLQAPQVVQQLTVTEKSLKGLGGWLVFWLIMFAIVGIGSIMNFATLLSFSDLVINRAGMTIGLILLPILTIVSIAAVVLIALQKRIARIASFAVFGVGALYGVLTAITDYMAGNNLALSTPATLIASILAMIVFYGLCSLYFIVSRRVKQTLVN